MGAWIQELSESSRERHAQASEQGQQERIQWSVFSQLKAGIANAQTNQQEASPVQEQAAKQVEEEQQHYHRSR